MRLTIQLIESSPQYINAFQQREIDLRSHRITLIENMGATKDAFDAIDLSENAIQKLENFSKLTHLKTLFVCNNEISSISPSIPDNLPHLETLNLQNNKILSFGEIENLKGCKHLKNLVLKDNPIYRVGSYRQKILAILPQLRYLDHMKVKRVEVEEALKVSQSTLDSDTFIPSGSHGPQESMPRMLTDSEKKMILQKLREAKTLVEANYLETCLRENRLP